MPRPPELDLHGLNVEQAVARFTATYNAARASGRSTRLVVIHGWNAGAFRGSIADTLHKLFTRRGMTFEHPFGGNVGRTAVRIGGALPEKMARTDAAISKKKPPTSSGAKGRLAGGL